MPHLVVRAPDAPDREFPLAGRPVVIGRAEDADLWIAEKRASRRHLRLAPVPGGGWTAEDLGSANGTFLAERRVGRVAIAHRDRLRVGDTTIELVDPDADPVGGTLAVVAVPGEGAAPGSPAARDPVTPDPGGSGEVVLPMDVRAMGRAAAFAIVALVAAAGAEILLGSRAREAESAASARREAREILEERDLVSLEDFDARVTEYLARRPGAREENERLGAFLADARARTAERASAEARLAALVAGRGTVPESEIREGLLRLAAGRPEGDDVALRALLALARLGSDRDAEALRAVDEAARRARLAVEQGLPGVALRSLAAVRAAWPLLPEEARRRLAEEETLALEAVTRREAEAFLLADREQDPERRRAVLAGAWAGLEGTVAESRLADALRFARPGSRPPESSAPTPGPAGEPGPLPLDLLARAAEAEKDFGVRRWTEARARFAELLSQVRSGLLHQEWSVRIEEIDRILGLVAALDEAAKAAAPLRRRLASGAVVVAAASPTSVTYGPDAPSVREVPWAEVPDREVTALLTPEKPTEEQRLVAAVVAASVGDTEGVVRLLLPFYEVEGASHEGADRIVGRYLFGRGAPPEGGYRAYRGEILDRAGYERRMEAERIAALRARAEETLARVIADPAFHRLEKLRELRAKLDEARRYALLAIFNEKHYPYPYQAGSKPYTAVQKEIDRRVAVVREIWEDGAKARVSRNGNLGKALEEWGRILADLKAARQDTSDLEARMRPWASYATGDTLTVRTFFLDERERTLLAYNRWVMEEYNPTKTAVAKEAEREQVRITNEYRMMMGFMGQVVPGDAPYPSIDDDNVRKVLDEAEHRYDPIPLKAVRIDDRLVRSARAHSEDMARRGFFDHIAPPNPASGQPATTPFDRMRTAGYTGNGASENICSGGGPMDAHQRWCHSSGHHRNILSAWEDLGSGFGGPWTQNFGIGGGEVSRPGAGGPVTPEGR